MTNPMNPTGNPATSGGNNDRDGQGIGRPLTPYRGGTNIVTNMSAPVSRDKECTFLDRARRAQFVVKTPTNVTAYTIHYGRWCNGRRFGGTGTELDGWLEVGTLAVTGATDGELFSVELDTYTDAVGCYVDGKTGTPATNFQFWVRGLPS